MQHLQDCYNLIPEKMQADQFWRLVIVKMTMYCFTCLGVQFLNILSLGENRFPKSACDIATLRRILNNKNKFIYIKVIQCFDW